MDPTSSLRVRRGVGATRNLMLSGFGRTDVSGNPITAAEIEEDAQWKQD